METISQITIFAVIAISAEYFFFFFFNLISLFRNMETGARGIRTRCDARFRKTRPRSCKSSVDAREK